MKYDISVIIPLYNSELYIKECLKSILLQDFKGKVECIVVDDCSTDNSAEVVEKYIEDVNSDNHEELGINTNIADVTYRLIKFETNKGCSAARNMGMKEAQGEFIAFVDSDDTLKSASLTMRYDAITSFNSNMVVGGHTRVFDHHRDEKIAKVRSTGSKRTPVDVIRHHNRESLAYVTTKLFRTEELRRLKLVFDESTNIAEDYLFSLQMLRTQSSVVIIPDSGYEHYVKKNTLSTTYHKNYAFARKEVVNIESDILHKGNHPKADTITQHHLTDFAYHAVRNLFRPGCDLSLSAKSKEIERFLFNDKQVYSAVKSGKYIYGDLLKRIQYLLVLTKSPMLMAIVFAILTKLKGE